MNVDGYSGDSGGLIATVMVVMSQAVATVRKGVSLRQ